MKVIDNDLIFFSDVDDTLVQWSGDCYKPHDGAIEIVDETDGTVVYLTPHQKHIDVLKKHKARGYTVFVWSAAGYKWASSVVKALGLENYVDYGMSKPLKHMDDLPCQEWMGSRIFLKDYGDK